MERPVLSIRNRASRRRLTKMEPGKNVRRVIQGLRAEGKYAPSAAREAIRAS